MAANKLVVFTPRALTTTTTANIWSPGTTTGGTNMPENVASLYFIFRRIRVVNTTNGPLFAALWRAASGLNTAGKEFIWGGVATAGALNANTGVSCPANSFLEWFGLARLDAADVDKFIVGGASAAGLTIQAEGEIGVS